MKLGLLGGVACAALGVFAAPTSAAAVTPAIAASSISVAEAVDAFYASRGGAPLWLRGGGNSSAANELIGILQRAPLDGFASGPALALQAQMLAGRASTGDPTAFANADRLLSTAWVMYVQTLQTPLAGMTYADSWVQPRRDTPLHILQRAAAAKSLAGYLREVSNVNPIYARLREAAWAEMQANGGTLDPRVVASLDRARDMPAACCARTAPAVVLRQRPEVDHAQPQLAETGLELRGRNRRRAASLLNHRLNRHQLLL